jgi:hypothetical protein
MVAHARMVGPRRPAPAEISSSDERERGATLSEEEGTERRWYSSAESSVSPEAVG